MDNKYNYVATLDEVAPPPPYVEARPTPPPVVETNLGLVLTLANLMVSAIIVIAMMLDGAQAKSAIVYGSLYFVVTMLGFVLVVTGALPAMVNGWQRERTERLRVAAYERVMEKAFDWRMTVEETRQLELVGRRGSTGGQRVSPLNTFVPAIADGEEAQSEGVRFAMGLYDTQGRPDSKRVFADGRLRGKMIGSKRGSGSRDAGLWLLREGIIKKVAGGYALNLGSYPNRDSLRHLL